jgi:hypothetical protein
MILLLVLQPLYYPLNSIYWDTMLFIDNPSNFIFYSALMCYYPEFLDSSLKFIN